MRKSLLRVSLFLFLGSMLFVVPSMAVDQVAFGQGYVDSAFILNPGTTTIEYSLSGVSRTAYIYIPDGGIAMSATAFSGGTSSSPSAFSINVLVPDSLYTSSYSVTVSGGSNTWYPTFSRVLSTHDNNYYYLLNFHQSGGSASIISSSVPDLGFLDNFSNWPGGDKAGYMLYSANWSSSPPEPSTLFVASCYNSSPFEIQFLTNLTHDTQVFNGSYNLYDSAFTPIYDYSGLTSPGLVNIVPSRSFGGARYTCFETINYDLATYDYIDVSGTFTFYAQSNYRNNLSSTDISAFSYPSQSYLTVNGEVQLSSDVSQVSDGVFAFNQRVYLDDLGENIVSVGVQSRFGNNISLFDLNNFDFGFYASNDLTITPHARTVYSPPADPTTGDVLEELNTTQNDLNRNNRQNQTIINQLFNIPNQVGENIGNLFIPSEDDIKTYHSLYSDLLEDKLGFVWQSGTLVTSFVSEFTTSMSGSITPTSFVFGPVTFPMGGQTYTIVPATTVSLDNDLLDILLPVLDSIICFICTLAFLNSCRDMIISLLSGASYMEYLGRRKEYEENAD